MRCIAQRAGVDSKADPLERSRDCVTLPNRLCLQELILCAKATEDKGAGERGRNRTFNLLIKSQLLCQLSYAPLLGREKQDVSALIRHRPRAPGLACQSVATR